MRLIDAESLVIAMSKRESTNCSPMYHRGYEDMLAAVAEATTIDAKSVVHGKWIVTDCERSDNQSYGDYIEVECSCCGYEIGAESGQFGWYYGDEFSLNYCPNCGADMRGSNDG